MTQNYNYPLNFIYFIRIGVAYIIATAILRIVFNVILSNRPIVIVMLSDARL